MTDRSLLAEADRCFDLKDYDQALQLYQKVFCLNPLDLEARTGVALSLVHMGKYADALPYLREQLKYMPDSEQLKVIFAEALNKSGQVAEAEAYLEELVVVSPQNIDAQVRLGRIYLDQDKSVEANNCFTAVLELDPNHVETLAYMGLLMIKFCQYDDAMKVLVRAYSLDEKNVLVLNNLGRACKMMGRHNDAISWYGKALEIEPDNVAVIGNYLFALNYCTGLAPEFASQEHFRLAPRYLPRNAHEYSFKNYASAGGKLRIGYVSGDFYTHSVSYFIEPIIQHHNYQRFEVYCYSVGATRDATTERLKALPCHWRDLAGEPPEFVSQKVREDRIDILVDLSGHTAENRLGVFAMRSAPVQVSWIGYPNTTGLPQMDYYVTDYYCDPPGKTEHLYSEKLYRMPQVFSCYLPPIEFPPVSLCPFFDNRFITFGSFNNFAKVTKEQMGIWAEILNKVPNSKLYLKSMALGDQSTKDMVLEQFHLHGISPERLVMRTVTMTPLEHFQEYAKVDIALDTYPYNGTTTTCEALWNGVPVITLAGTTHVSRVGLSFLTSLNLPEFVAYSADEYVDIAVRLADDKVRLCSLRDGVRYLMAASPLMDAVGFTKTLENGYEEMAQNSVQGILL